MRDACPTPTAADSRTLENSLRTAAPKLRPGSRRCSTFAWPFRRSGNRARSGHQEGRGAKRIVANTMADCLAFWRAPGLKRARAHDRRRRGAELVNEALAGQDYVDAGTGPIGCTIATHVGVDAIAISYCPRYQPTR
ncbi:MAG: hypothetical protein ACLTYW_07705 [Collinsella sp.]